MTPRDMSSTARARRRLQSQQEVTTTATPKHGPGFVVPTFIVGSFGGGRSTLTCRDCDQEEANGHLDTCPQTPLNRMIQAQQELRAIVERRREQPPFTVFTLLFWIAVGIAVSTPLLGFLLYALGLLEFRR